MKVIPALYFSLTNHEEQIFKLKNNKVHLYDTKEIKIKLTHSKIYANFYYEGHIEEDRIMGRIIKDKNPIMNWNVCVLIVVFTLSEILIFPYAIGALMHFFKHKRIIKILNGKLIDYDNITDEAVGKESKHIRYGTIIQKVIHNEYISNL